jgi:succinoglycan biosynthesis protein ExoV
MKLHYHLSKNKNFGDEMNPWFWHTLAPEILAIDNDDYICGIGTIINDTLPKENSIHILGSGHGYEVNKNFTLPKNAIAHFVRGPLSAKALGLSEKHFITDPGLLIADLHPGSDKKNYAMGFVPHESIHSERLESFFNNHNIKYISPTLPYKQVFDLISSCEKIICSAMHGAIIADSYRVPWLPIVTSNEILQFKWLDWCQSVSLDYSPIKLTVIYPNISDGYFGKMKAVIKKMMFMKKIENIAQNGEFVLSLETIYKQKKTELKNKIQKFTVEILK